MIVRLLITNFSVCLDPLSRSGRLFLTFQVNGHSFYDNNGDNGFWADLIVAPTSFATTTVSSHHGETFIFWSVSSNRGSSSI